MGTGGFFQEVKRPGSEADHSLPTSAKEKYAWNYTSALSYVFMEWCLVTQHRCQAHEPKDICRTSVWHTPLFMFHGWL